MPRIHPPFTVLLVTACLSTDADQSTLDVDCGDASTLAEPENAIVRVDANMSPGTVVCSGVAIAKTLVVTAMGCVMRPSTWADPNPGFDLTFGNPPPLESFDGQMPNEATCHPSGGWMVTEDGSLTGRWGQSIEASDVEVFRPRGERIKPSDIVTSRAVSRCADGIALLLFDRELDVTPVPVRLDAEQTLGEAVTLRGYCRASPVEVSSAVDTVVDAVTFDMGTEALPPRSLSIASEASTLEIGGAISSRQSGALLGILASAHALTCAERAPTGRAAAVRLAPFRRMLLETAASHGVQLQLERIGAPVTRDHVRCR